MFSFTKRPEEAIQLAGETYRINLAFNVVIKAFGVLENKELSNEEKIEQCFNLFLIDDFKFNDLAIKGDVVADVFKYINEKPYGNFNDDNEKTAQNNTNIDEVHSDFDYEQDAGAIYASFLNYYHIDLNQMIDKMHWDNFKTLFENLGPETPIQRIRQYRNDDLSNYSDDPKQSSFIAEQQSYYKLDKEVGTDAFSSNAASVFQSLFEEAK